MKKSAVIIILGVVILALCAYIVYEKDLFNLKKSKQQSSETKTFDMNSFPKSNDSDVLELSNFQSYLTNDEMKTNFSNIQKTVNGVNLVFNCESYFTDENENPESNNVCAAYSVKVNNVITIDEQGITNEGCGVGYSVLKTKTNYITKYYEECTSTGKVTVFDLKGNRLYVNDFVATSFTNQKRDDIFVKDNTLYFAEYEDSNRGENAPLLIIKYNLHTNEKSIAGKTTGYVGSFK